MCDFIKRLYCSGWVNLFCHLFLLFQAEIISVGRVQSRLTMVENNTSHICPCKMRGITFPQCQRLTAGELIQPSRNIIISEEKKALKIYGNNNCGCSDRLLSKLFFSYSANMNRLKLLYCCMFSCPAS